MPDSASAFCCTSAPAIVTGAIAPDRVNGVTTTAWPADAICMMPSIMGTSSFSGELVLMIVKTDGSSRSCSREMPRASLAISMPSTLRSLPSE